MDELIFALSDNSKNLSLAYVSGVDVVDLRNDTNTTYTLRVGFDDVSRSDNKFMLISGTPYDDIIELSTSSNGGAVTWSHLNTSIYNGTDGYYYDVWQGSDSNTATPDVSLLMRQNMTVTQIDPTANQFFKFHFTYTSGDVYYGTGYASGGTYTAGQTLSSVSGAAGIYTRLTASVQKRQVL